MIKDQVVTVQDWHVEQLSKTMQKEDVDSVWALGHLTPQVALERSVALSNKSFTWLHEGDVGCIWGYESENPLSYVAYPWLLASPLVHKSPRYFLRGCRQFISLLLDRHHMLTNVIDALHTRSLKWIQFCGAKLFPATEMGPEGLPFIRHEIRR